MFLHTCVVILATPTRATYVMITKLIPLLCMAIKGKGRVHPTIGHEGPEGEERYSSTLSLTSALDGVGGQSHAPATLPPEKTRYPLYRRPGGPRLVWTSAENLIPTGIRSAEFFHAAGRTDLTKLIVAFRNFANAPKNATHFAFIPVLNYIKTL